MPKATPAIRQSNSAARALATVRALQNSERQVTPSAHADSSTLGAVEAGDASAQTRSDDDFNEVDQEETELPAIAERKRLKWDKASGEDFFEYLNSIPQEERTQGRLRFFATNQDGSIGGMVHQIVGGWTDVDESWMRQQPEIGIGKFKVELRNPGKTGRANDWTIIQIGSDEEISKQRLTKQGLNKQGRAEEGTQAINVVASAADKGMDFLGKSYEKALEVRQNSSDPVALAKALTEMNGKQPDLAALLTGFGSILAAVMPKKDGEESKLLITMLENQRQDAERRADAAEKRAEEQRRMDREESDRRERLAKEEFERRDRDRKDELERRDREAREREQDRKQFYEMMMKEKEHKDELGLGGIVKDLVIPLVKDRFEGGGAPEGWAGVAANFADRIPDLVQGVSAMMAARNGATPQQVQQMQAQAQQQPQQLAAQSQPQDRFPEMLYMIARYLERDPATWRKTTFVIDLIENQYPGIYSEIFLNQKKEAIFERMKADPNGAAIFAHELGQQFMSDVIDCIKSPDLIDTHFPEEPEPEDEEPIITGRRKPNGRAKVVA